MLPVNIPLGPKVLPLDSLIGEPHPHDPGRYFYPIEGDETEVGYMLSGTGVRVWKTIHIPTGSEWAYRKINLITSSGNREVVWEKFARVSGQITEGKEK